MLKQSPRISPDRSLPPARQAAAAADPGVSFGTEVDPILQRALDLVIAGPALLLLAPLFLVLGLAVRLGDGGPVFYRAQRVGRHGRPFRLYKFRTMVVDADRAGCGLTAGADPRITRVGRFLRQTKLDELPQLLNVLRGEMSLTGPRPEDPRYVALYTAEQRAVLAVRPGITSAASLRYRHEADLLGGADWETVYRQEVMPAKLALDLEYLARRTLRSDLGLLARTAVAMFHVRGASAARKQARGWAPAGPGAHPGGPPPGRRTPPSPDRLPPGMQFLLQLRNRHFLALDAVLFLLTPAMALALRFDGTLRLDRYGPSLLVATLVFWVIKLAILFKTGLYSRFWRYASIDELGHIIVVGLLVTMAQTLVFFSLLRPLGLVLLDFPRSVPVIDGLLLLMLIGGVRYSVRLAESLQERHGGDGEGIRVLVVGAGDAGVMIVEEMRANPRLGLRPVGFVDDAPEKQRARIRGVQVLGTRTRIPELVRETGARQVIIAMPRAPGKTIREIVHICEQAGVETRTIPGIYEILDGSVSVNQLRHVDIVDLLRREPVQTDIAAVRDLVQGRRVLITGGGGSIGGELCRQVLRCAPAELVVLGHGENSVFEIVNELQRIEGTGAAGGDAAPASVIRPIIADIRFAARIESIFREVRPEIVFHAAAHKHVPLMEVNPSEAISNNVLGTRNLLDACRAVGVAHFVMLSTDKAVNPTSLMGASKRAAELLVHQAALVTGRPYVAVRFGNVLGSRGSVLHTFRQQIAAGGPITITHPDITRFFMTIPEAVQLVLQAAVLGQGGEVFVLDMGEPVKIMDLARDLIALSGLEVGRDIDVVCTGLRPGEKLFEELFVLAEEYMRTRHEKIFIASNASSAVPVGLDASLAALEAGAGREDTAAILGALQALIPEFQPAANGVAARSRNSAPAPVEALAAAAH